MHNVTRKSEYQKGRYLDYLGTSLDTNITYIGLNLVYYCASAHLESEQLYKFLDEVFEEDRYITPMKECVPINIQYGKEHITISSEYDNVNTTLANLDSFVIDYPVKNTTLLYVNKGTTNIDIQYMYFKEGLVCTILGLLGYSIVCVIIWSLPMYCKAERKEDF